MAELGVGSKMPKLWLLPLQPLAPLWVAPSSVVQHETWGSPGECLVRLRAWMTTPHRAPPARPPAETKLLGGYFFFKGKKQQENLSPAASCTSFIASFVLYLIFCFIPS